jgi:pyrroloquinoline quinone biosynthesis protein B
MSRASFWVVALVTVAAPIAPARTQGAWELVVLGRAQDAGIPHLSCTQAACVERRAGTRPAERVASLGLRHTGTGRAYLFDATPDLPSQVHSLTGGRTPDGIFLTHGHMGHYTGLMYLGRESIGASKVPVYGTSRMTTFLTSNGPWSQLVTLNNVALRTMTPDTAVDLGDGVRVTPFLVPHRDEFTDTVGYLIEGPAKRALFIPDIDQWSKWDRDIRALADTVDYAFLDGTFASAGEIPGRSMADIPHPMMSDTRARLKGTRAQLWFIHINHTNTSLDAADVVKDGVRYGM